MNELQAQIWDAMDIGPIWIVRDGFDPLLKEVVGNEPKAEVAEQNPQAQFRAVTAGISPEVKSSNVITIEPQAEALNEYQIEEINKSNWVELEAKVKTCKACELFKYRQHAVFAENATNPKFVIVGEAPGADEDAQGIPFVGKSGQLLTSMLTMIGVKRKEDVIILNAIKCRPPKNRNPENAELAICTNYLRRQLELIKPRLILCMGRFATRAVLGIEDTTSIALRRGKVFEATFSDVTAKVVVTYHPSYYLRQPEQKAQGWIDLLFFKDVASTLNIDLTSPFEKKD